MMQEESSEQKSATGGCEKSEDIGNNWVREAGVGDVARVMMKEAERRSYVILPCWVASYLMSVHGRDDYLISPSWLGGHTDTFVKDI
ncbi:hypothetical protein DUI87_23257 [Hirundo rustica rustica]|uniref:Uncharacterized protein n=1 Tax=Hirundo rustica rustica TaxID=333673 RepID=A0A3M0JPH5_HIRRU|nr:hypothetical protein DUI87_23257 [Hirundo rustica rustica]